MGIRTAKNQIDEKSKSQGLKKRVQTMHQTWTVPALIVACNYFLRKSAREFIKNKPHNGFENVFAQSQSRRISVVALSCFRTVFGKIAPKDL